MKAIENNCIYHYRENTHPSEVAQFVSLWLKQLSLALLPKCHLGQGAKEDGCFGRLSNKMLKFKIMINIFPQAKTLYNLFIV